MLGVFLQHLRIDIHRLRQFRSDLVKRDVLQQLDHVGTDPLVIGIVFDHGSCRAEQLSCILLLQGIEQTQHVVVGQGSQHRFYRGREHFASAITDCLIQQTQRVPHAAIGCGRQLGQCTGVGCDLLLLGQELQVRQNLCA